MSRNKLIFFATLAFLIYVALKFISPWYGFVMVRDMTEVQAKLAASNKDRWIRKKIFQIAKSYNVPMSRDDIKITRENGYIKIRFAYDIIINVLDLYETKKHYSYSTERLIRR